MNIGHIQSVLTSAGFQPGPIDGKTGPKTQAAIQAAANLFRLAGYSSKRLPLAVVQACLNQLGHEAGVVDGWWGHNTANALEAFLHKFNTGQDLVIERAPVGLPDADINIPHQGDVAGLYGRPGPDIAGQLELITLPFKLRIDWNLRQQTNKIRVHELAAPSLKMALIAVHGHYGPDEMKRLGIDRYAGAYNHRKMRGGSKWSMHAYGCAIDFFAAPNGLRARCPKALFCGPKYKPFLDIMEGHGWLPALRLWGADAMHFQRAKL